MLKHWGYKTIDDAFEQILATYQFIKFFLLSNNIAFDDRNGADLELLKESLERAFSRSEDIAKELSI